MPLLVWSIRNMTALGHIRSVNTMVVMLRLCLVGRAITPKAMHNIKSDNLAKRGRCVEKIAINIDDLQCDFDYDWAMPLMKDGDVYDSEHAIDDKSFDYLTDEAEFVMAELKNGTLKIEE